MLEARPLRILIADDHAIFRDGLRRLLEAERGFAVIGEASSAADAVRQVADLDPDVLLLDYSMPRGTGLDALKALPESARVRTILLTAAIDRPQIVEAIRLGARGVVLKEAATSMLLKCIEKVMAGELWIGRENVADLVQFLREETGGRREEPKKAAFGLTPRELEIVGTIVAGYTNKDIARKLAISEDTVKHHLSNIFDKCGVSNRLELALFAVNHQLVEGT